MHENYSKKETRVYVTKIRHVFASEQSTSFISYCSW